MTFDAFCDDFRVTAAERAKLVEYLAFVRAMRTIRVLGRTALAAHEGRT